MKSVLCEFFNQYCLICKQNYSENKEKHDCITNLLKIVEHLQENLGKDNKYLVKENFNLRKEIEYLKNQLHNRQSISHESHLNEEFIHSENDKALKDNDDDIKKFKRNTIINRNKNTLSLNSVKNFNTEGGESQEKTKIGWTVNKSNTNIRQSFDKQHLIKSSSNFPKDAPVTIKKNLTKERSIFNHKTVNLASASKSNNLLNNNLFYLESSLNYQLDRSKILKELDFLIVGDFFAKKRNELIFRASENNFKAEKFHQICDGKSPTLTIIKSNYGKIFGAYTKCKWNSNNNWITDESRSSFIFSVHNSSRHVIKHPKHAIFSEKNNGPIFGKGYDIYISNNCNVNNNSFCNLGISYSLNNSAKSESIESKSYLAGNVNFKVSEYEVFQIFDM